MISSIRNITMPLFPRYYPLRCFYPTHQFINSFLNKYNEINDPDITSDMVSMKKLEGKDEPSIVDISNDKFEVYIR